MVCTVSRLLTIIRVGGVIMRDFGMTVDFWTGIQVHYDTEMAKMSLGNRLEQEVKVLVQAA